MHCHAVACLLASLLTLGFTASCSAQDPPSDDRELLRDVPKDVGPIAKIAADDAPGERLLIQGTVYRADGMTPADGALIYFYQTNATGRYQKRGDEDRSSFAWWHGFTRGFAKTGADGRYTLDTVRPAPYPEGDEPAHIHSSILPEPGGEFHGIADFVFLDDPLLGPRFWKATEDWGVPRYDGVRLQKVGARWEGRRNLFMLPTAADGPQVGPAVGWRLPAVNCELAWKNGKPTTGPWSLPGTGAQLLALASMEDLETLTPLVERLGDIGKTSGERASVIMILRNQGKIAPERAEADLRSWIAEKSVETLTVAQHLGSDGKAGPLTTLGGANIFIVRSGRIFAKGVSVPMDDSYWVRVAEALQRAAEN